MRSRTSFKGETSRVSAFAISAGIVLALFAPQFAPAQEISTGSAVSQGSLSVTQEALKAALLSRGSGDRDGAKSTPNAVEAFYAARDYWPVWSGTRDANRAAGAARSILSQADRQGLDSSAYTASSQLRSDTVSPGREAALFDIALTDAVLRYAHDVHSGRVRPRDIYSDIRLPSTDFDASAGLASALRSGSVESYLNGLPPSHQGYRNLVQALARYRQNTKQDSSLNARIQQIVANMERWRWVPAQFERRYISINVPDQNLEFISDGKVLMTSKVIVGRKTTPTPILRTVSDSIIANPPWNVPSDIAARQLLPNLKRNPNYLAGHNMVVLDGPAGDPRGATIDWDGIPAGQFPYQVRQLPGPASAMGIVMLDSPNDFDVYLHDTPGKKPFGDDERGISNGCIRVQQMLPLASLALTNDTSAGLTQVNGAIASRETQRIPLTDPIPIYMLYWTAVADADGNVGFRGDRYDRDPPLIRALNSAAVASR